MTKRLEDDRLRGAGGGNQGGVLQGGETELGEQGRDLVAGEQAVGAIGLRAGHAHAVGIRVGRQHEVGPDLPGELEREREGRGAFGVRGRHGREAPVMLQLFMHEVRVQAEAAERRDHGHVAGAVQVGVDDLRRMARHQLRLEDDAGHAGQVSLLGDAIDDAHAGQVLLEVGRDIRRPELADLRDDGDVVGRGHLAAVAEAALEAVVVRRVVAGRDDDAGLGPQMPHREAELRRGTRAGEEVGLATELRPGGGHELGEVPGEMADIVGDDDPRGRVRGGDVAPEAERRAQDVDVVQAGGPDGRPDRGAVGGEFVGGGDPADRPAAHAAGPEGDTLVETVLEFGPGAPGDEVGQRLQGGGGQGARLEPPAGLTEGGGGQLALDLGGPEGGEEVDGGGAHGSRHPCPPGGGDKPGGGGGGG